MTNLNDIVGKMNLRGDAFSKRTYSVKANDKYITECDCDSGSDCSECGGGDCSDCDCTSQDCT